LKGADARTKQREFGDERKKPKRVGVRTSIYNYATYHLKTWLSPSDITFDGNFLNLFTKAGTLRAWSFAPSEWDGSALRNSMPADHESV
jgi:hypothetical protein